MPTLKKMEDLKKIQINGGTSTLNQKMKETNNYQKPKTTLIKPISLTKSSPTNLKIKFNSYKMKFLNLNSKLSEKITNSMKTLINTAPSSANLKMNSENPDLIIKNSLDNSNKQKMKNIVLLKTINKKTVFKNLTSLIKSDSLKTKETPSIKNLEEQKNPWH